MSVRLSIRLSSSQFDDLREMLAEYLLLLLQITKELNEDDSMNDLQKVRAAGARAIEVRDLLDSLK